MISAAMETTCHTLAIDSAKQGKQLFSDLALGTGLTSQTRFIAIDL